MLRAPRSLLENKFSHRQIPRISDFEIELFVHDQGNLGADQFDRGDFVCDRKVSLGNQTITLLEKFPLKNLRSLHGVQLMSIHRISDVKILIRSLDRIGNRRREGGRSMDATLSEHALNL